MDGAAVFGLTTPLITTSSGAKMGKTAAGAVWLSAERLSVFDYWQFWRNVEDADVGRFLRLFTDLPLDEIARLGALGGAEINEAKKVLAHEATTLLHGAVPAARAAETARSVFEQGGADGLDTYVVDRAALETGLPIEKLLADCALVASRGEGRRLILGDGARLNDAKIIAGQLLLTSDFSEGVAKLSAGRKKHRLLAFKA